jgi:hypothetical protein
MDHCTLLIDHQLSNLTKGILSDVKNALIISSKKQVEKKQYLFQNQCDAVYSMELNYDISGRGLLGYDTVQWCGTIPTFQGTLLPPSAS